jgi:polysaccharide biosynthesis protein PslG
LEIMNVNVLRPSRLLTALAGAGLIASSIIGPTGAMPTAVAATTRPALGIAAGGTLQFETAAQQEAYLSAAQELGATWLRFDFAWTDIQRSNAASYDWTRYDTLVARAQAHGMQVVGMIGYTPGWARDAACTGTQFCRPKDPAAYATFAGQAAARFAPRGVHHWEIWNEQNTALFFKPAADPVYYTSMLRQAYSAIHAADPKAVVITGGTAPAASNGGDLSPVDFVSRSYAAGAKNNFDALGHHPYCYAGSFDCPDSTQAWSAWSQMASTPTSLRSLLTANGDAAKQIWGTEFGAPTAGASAAVTEGHQATMLATAVARWSSYAYTGGPLFLYSLKDRGTNPGNKEDWFGVLRADGSHKQSFTKLQTALQAAPAATPAAPAAPPAAAPPTTAAPAATAPPTTAPPATAPPATVPPRTAPPTTTTPATQPATTQPATKPSASKPARHRKKRHRAAASATSISASSTTITTDPWSMLRAWLRYRAT